MTKIDEFAQYPRDALCAEIDDPEVFFPVDEDAPKVEGADPAGVARAKAICSMCPVRAACLWVGIAEPIGVWGGLTTAERQDLARRSRRSA
jgi:WhiB family redox-sensing transcriptional regulator